MECASLVMVSSRTSMFKHLLSHCIYSKFPWNTVLPISLWVIYDWYSEFQHLMLLVCRDSPLLLLLLIPFPVWKSDVFEAEKLCSLSKEGLICCTCGTAAEARLRSKMGTDSSEEHAKAEHVNHEVDEVWHTKQTTTPLVPDHGGSISHPNKIFQLSTCLE